MANTSTALAPARDADANAALVERIAIIGDLKELSATERVRYYFALCDSLGLNKLSRPFEYLLLGKGKDEKLVLYTTRTATDQIAEKVGVSFPEYRDEVRDIVYLYHVRAVDKSGRTLWRTGVVPIVKEDGSWSGPDGNRKFTANGKFIPLSPEALANAMMKAETKAHRRATLAIAGLGFMDESEIDTVKDARRVQVDLETGEIVDGQVVDRQDAPASDVATSVAATSVAVASTPGNGETTKPGNRETGKPAPRMTPDEVKAAWVEQNDRAQVLGIEDWMIEIPSGQKLAWYIDEVQRRHTLLEQAEAELIDGETAEKMPF